MTPGELHSRVESAITELREYQGFVSQLETLKRSLLTDKFDDAILQATQNAIPGRLRPHRGVIPADDSLRETRYLINVLNLVVKARRSKRN